MGALGKYVRHAIAAAVGALAAWANGEWGMTLDAEFQAAVVVIVYAMVEKLLKRFGWLDPEGAADRLAIKKDAAMRSPLV